jgi:hypothetical protein
VSAPGDGVNDVVLPTGFEVGKCQDALLDGFGSAGIECDDR